jgi:hypothetical protein
MLSLLIAPCCQATHQHERVSPDALQPAGEAEPKVQIGGTNTFIYWSEVAGNARRYIARHRLFLPALDYVKTGRPAHSTSAMTCVAACH